MNPKIPRFYYRGPSATHGIGVFASRAIPAGTVWWSGEMDDYIQINRGQYQRLMMSQPSQMLAEVQQHSFYVSSLDCLLFICNDGRYINHSATPNCAALGFAKSITLRDIREGEELFEDYRQYDICPWAELWGMFGKQLRSGKCL
jgi:hypothetical protein